MAFVRQMKGMVPTMKFFFYNFLFMITVQAALAQDSPLTLPVYKVTIDSVYLEQLYEEPYSDDEYPALFIFGKNSYKCSVRFRGGTARDLPKKSWKIKFEDTENIFLAKELNLNAEYRDKSLLRNHLGLKLFEYFGWPSPQTAYISLFVNEKYMGVFLQVEQVDVQFFAKRGMGYSSLYKAYNGANTMPFLKYSSYRQSWELKTAGDPSYSELQLLFNRFLYYSDKEFNENISALVDVDNVLNYFAIIFALSDADGIFKNFYFFRQKENAPFAQIPWDMDATFGNNWKGNYYPSKETYNGYHFKKHLLIQRLLQDQSGKELFWGNVNHIIAQGLPYLSAQADTTFEIIKNDVYQDTAKRCTNSEFDEALAQVKNFLIKRAEYLNTQHCFHHIKLSDFYCSEFTDSTQSDSVVFRIHSAKAQHIKVKFVRNLQFNHWGGEFDESYLDLYDDGLHHDLKNGDGIYGNKLNLTPEYTGIIPFAFIGDSGNYYPDGLFYVQYRTNQSLALNINLHNHTEVGQIHFDELYKYVDDYFVTLVNPLPEDVNLSYCRFQSGPDYNRVIFPVPTVLRAKDTLIITSNKKAAEVFFPQKTIVEHIYFDIRQGDSLKFLSPVLSGLSRSVCGPLHEISDARVKVVINEINYHSADTMDVGDWVELYNPNSFAVDLSHWIFKDSRETHHFEIPQGTVVKSGEYLVLCQDRDDFLKLFPDSIPLAGDFDFGLSGSGELIRLYNPMEEIIDSLTYDDDAPWPVAADGRGYTLELYKSALDNALASSWKASLNAGGTPGRRNSVSPTGISISQSGSGIAGRAYLEHAFPNPFNSAAKIKYSLASQSNVQLVVYNVLGQKMAVLFKGRQAAAAYSFIWNADTFPAGLYFIRLTTDKGFVQTRKLILLR